MNALRSHKTILVYLVTVLLFTLTSCGGGGGSNTNPPPPPPPTSNPAPVVTSLSPTSISAGTSVQVTVTGTGFISSSLVLWNGTEHATTFVSATQLQFTLTAAEVATVGTAQVMVRNPTPGGGTSSAASFAINNPAPTVTSASPAQLIVAAGDTTILLTGNGFLQSSVVQLNGVPLPATYVNAIQLQVKIPAADLANAGTANLTVSNAEPGGGSAAIAVPIVYASPAITELLPNIAVVGSSNLPLAVAGTGFSPASVVNWNGTPLTTQFVSNTRLRATIVAASLASTGTAEVTVTNPSPGGGTSTASTFTIDTYPVPVIASVSPVSVYVGASTQYLYIYGTGFQTISKVHVNGTPVPTTWVSYCNPLPPACTPTLVATLDSTLLANVGTLGITVVTPPPSGGTSNEVSFEVLALPAPILTSVSPNAAPIGSGDVQVSLGGEYFSPSSVVLWNGSPRTTEYVASYNLKATIPASDLTTFATSQISVQTPAPGGGTSESKPFTTYLALPTKDLVYNPVTQLLYASVPSSGGPALGNSIVPIDPYTGVLGTPIWVGSEPNKLSLSSDGSTMWVSLSSVPSVKKVDLTTGQLTAVNAYISDSYSSVTSIAAMPGTTNSVGVSAGGNIWVFDDSTARPKHLYGSNYIAFGGDSSSLYGAGSYDFRKYSVDSTGVLSSETLNVNSSSSDLRIDNGLAYLTSGAVVKLSTMSLAGTFAATGPVAPDSTIGRAFILNSSQRYYYPDQITAFDIDTFVPLGSYSMGGLDTNYPGASSLVRWGQDGLAFRTGTQVYILRSPLVRDLSSTSLDLATTIAAPSSSASGSNANIDVTVKNNGASAAEHVTLMISLPLTAPTVTVTPAQGSCVGTTVLRCSLGSIANGASVATSLVVLPTEPGSLKTMAMVSALQPDSDTSNNNATASTTITGEAYNLVPQANSVSPSSAPAGSETVSITVIGTNFGSGSTVTWNGTDLPTTYVDSTHLTATVSAALTSNMGTAAVAVSNPVPGGGNSATLPFTIFRSVALDTNDIVFDPFSRKFYATVPSTATQVTGNSIVSIDPLTGTLGTPVFVGSEPNHLAISDDGKYLYFVLTGASRIARFDLASNTLGTSFSLKDQYGTAFVPGYISVMPGARNTIAAASNGIKILDVSDSDATERTFSGQYNYNGGPLTWADATTFFAGSLYKYNVGPTSFSLLSSSNSAYNYVSGNIIYDAGRIYADSGAVADGQSMQVLGKYPPSPTSYGNGPVAVDAAINRVYFVDRNSYGVNSRTISIYDAKKFLQIGWVQLAGFEGDASHLSRWGTDGLAFRTEEDNSRNRSGYVYFFRGGSVLLTTGVNQTPTATSLSPASATAGDWNTWVTVTGANFAPGAVALWNGSERYTKVVDSTHLKVAIPASDLATAGSATVTVTNVGTSASGSLTFTVN